MNLLLRGFKLLNNLKKNIKYLNIVIIIFICVSVSYADEIDLKNKNMTTNNTVKLNESNYWYLPDLVMVQTAGYLGYIVGGFGYTFFNEKLETIACYGYVPKNIGGKRIHTFAFKNSFYPFKFNLQKIVDIFPLYFGITALFSLDKETYWTISTDCPDYYYPPTGAHLALNVGTQLVFKKNHAFFIELSMLDTYAKAYFWDDHKHLEFNECVTLAMGYKMFF